MRYDHAEQEPLLRHAQPENIAHPDIEHLIDAKFDDEGEIRWATEAKLVLNSSAQLAGTYFLQYFYNLVIILVVSHLGRNELAAVSIGITTMNIFGFAVFEGMATSLDTLCSQSFGAGKLKHVGLHMHRMNLFFFLVGIPIALVWIFSPWILIRLIPQPQLAAPAGTFLRITLIGLPGYALFESGKRFLQAQGDFSASLLVLVLCAPINLLLNWLFVFHLNWSIAGAALAAALTNNIRALMLLLYVLFVKPSTLQCWHPMSSAILKNWGPMAQLAGAGAVMTLCEWAPFEILTFSTAYIGTAALAAQTLLANVTVLTWHIPFSASIAVSTRIGHLVGAGALALARQLPKLYGALFLLCGLLAMAFVLLLRNAIAGIVTNDREVQELIKSTLPYLAIFVIFDATTCCTGGIMRGLARQSYGGWIRFFANFFYAVPLAIFLELGKPHLGLPGVWIALTTCLLLVTSSEIVVMRVMNWQKCIDEARSREIEHS
jgi:multidrug resistance protein, MATE family